MKKFLLISTLMLSVISMKAQDLIVIESTKQWWAAGPCCSSGIDYIIILESCDTTNFITIDTVWLGKSFYAKLPPDNFTINRLRENEKTIYQIKITVATNTEPVKYMPKDSIAKTKKPIISINPPKYKGEGCVQYQINNKKKIISIEKFKRLQGIAMP